MRLYVKLVCLAAILLPYSVAYAQISPGDLTQSHARLEGMSNCTKCHTLGKQVENQRCLDCHTEIKSLQQLGKGYHASADVSGKKCVLCHLEHHGRNFQIVRFDPKKFDHRKTGYELTGKHKDAECNKCHQPAHIPKAISKKKSNTYLGLVTACANCHEDNHAGKLGTDCGKCHNTSAFKPVALFDHAKTNFRLTGAHLNVDCGKCHKQEMRNGKTVQTFSTLPFGNCTPCHKDRHDGKFDAVCTKCHNTTSFNKVNLSSFDHSKTRFALTGKHTSVKCESCHGKDQASKPKFAACTDCHKDYHNQQFLTADKTVTPCDNCHTVEGFKPSLFTIPMHNAGNFRLEGSHLSLPCIACHFKENSWKFKPLQTKCVTCHDNVHGKEISAKFLGESHCENCHNVNTWQKVSFDHTKTEFQLTGKHASLSCNSCHMKNDAGVQKHIFSSLKTSCTQCHTDIHRGQFDDGTPNYCTRCHAAESWKPVTFNHDNTKFSLRGAHENVPCKKCHKEETHSSGSYTLYKVKDFKCAACHS